MVLPEVNSFVVFDNVRIGLAGSVFVSANSPTRVLIKSLSLPLISGVFEAKLVSYGIPYFVSGNSIFEFAQNILISSFVGSLLSVALWSNYSHSGRKLAEPAPT